MFWRNLAQLQNETIVIWPQLFQRKRNRNWGWRCYPFFLFPFGIGNKLEWPRWWLQWDPPPLQLVRMLFALSLIIRVRGSYGDLRSRQKYKDGNKSLVGICQFVNKLSNEIYMIPRFHRVLQNSGPWLLVPQEDSLTRMYAPQDWEFVYLIYSVSPASRMYLTRVTNWSKKLMNKLVSTKVGY